MSMGPSLEPRDPIPYALGRAAMSGLLRTWSPAKALVAVGRDNVLAGSSKAVAKRFD